MSDLNALFTADQSQERSTNARNLAGTTQLTNVSTAIANEILKTVNDNFESSQELVAKSKKDHGAMDELITTAYDLSFATTDFLTELDEATLDGMLKSQQSKRSRSKGKVMTMDNYKTMMTAAIAENLIRLHTGKTKQSGGAHRVSGRVDYTAEELEELQLDQDRLRKEIRNIQSKKSIMKSKEGFSEDDERWGALLEAEEQLKSRRNDVKITVVDDTKNKLSEMLVNVDINNLKSSDAKKLVEQAMALIIDNKEDASDESNV